MDDQVFKIPRKAVRRRDESGVPPGVRDHLIDEKRPGIPATGDGYDSGHLLAHEHAHGHRKRRAIWYSTTFSIVVVTIATVVAFAISIWIIARTRQRHASWTAGSTIGRGGSFTQPQAKILDIVSSAIIAPLIMVLFNYYCFNVARSYTVNDQTGLKHSLSLQALVEVSTTDWGSYSPFKFINLVQTKQFRIILLATITILSALSFSTLTNVVAYEAFTQNGHSATASLQFLYRAPSHILRDASDDGGQLPLLNTTRQNAQFTSQWFDILTTLSYTTAEALLDNGAYIGINMTNASIAQVPSNMNTIYSVPAYRLTYQCKPAVPKFPGLLTPGSQDQALLMTLTAASPVNDSASLLYQGYINNGASTILSADTGVYQIIAYGLGPISTSLYLGNIGTFNTTNYTTVTSFGPLSHTAFNNTLIAITGTSGTSAAAGDLGIKAVLSAWGIICSIYRQEGTVDLYRDTMSGVWKRSIGQFSNDKKVIPLIVRDLQLTPPYVSPIVGTIPGLGGALAASTNITASALNAGAAFPGEHVTDYEDFETLAKNYLYVEGEARRIAYEVAMETPLKNSTNNDNLKYTVNALTSQQRYRMTYVPWVLVLGLVCLVVMGLLVLRLAVIKKRVGDGRVVTPLRVLADVAGSGITVEELEGRENWSQKDITDWSQRYKVRYVRVNDETGNSLVRLRTG